MSSQLKKNIVQQTPQRGFSLIEVLVSLSIFAVVVTIAIGALIALIGANARTQNTQAVMTNISYALDSMTREIRTGTDFFCGTGTSLPVSGGSVRDCSSGGPAFSFNEGGMSLTEFTANNSRRIGYRLENGSIERRLGNGSWAQVTAPEIKITALKYVVTGSTRGDSVSPTVTLYVAGTAGEVNDDSLAGFNIQTTVVQQLLDI
jgi:prepilin-type N-terminal cleavage/methylation domain-containing protein